MAKDFLEEMIPELCFEREEEVGKPRVVGKRLSFWEVGKPDNNGVFSVWKGSDKT